MAFEITERNGDTQRMAKHFYYDEVPRRLQDVPTRIHDFALDMIAQLPDGPELTAGLRKLLEARDCFMRANNPPA